MLLSGTPGFTTITIDFAPNSSTIYMRLHK